jgi:hypothetical protein
MDVVEHNQASQHAATLDSLLRQKLMWLFARSWNEAVCFQLSQLETPVAIPTFAVKAA